MGSSPLVSYSLLPCHSLKLLLAHNVVGITLQILGMCVGLCVQYSLDDVLFENCMTFVAHLWSPHFVCSCIRQAWNVMAVVISTQFHNPRPRHALMIRCYVAHTYLRLSLASAGSLLIQPFTAPIVPCRNLLRKFRACRTCKMLLLVEHRSNRELDFYFIHLHFHAACPP